MTMRQSMLLVFLLPLTLSAQSLEEGIALMARRDFHGAKSVFEAILKQNDQNADAHYRLAQVYLTNQLRDVDAAVDHCEEAVDLNPKNADYQYLLGAALGLKARDAGVIKQALLAPKVKGAFEKAVELNPNLVDAQIGLAEYYHRAPGFMGGDDEKAWKTADVVVKLDELRGRSLRANFLLGDKKPAEAAQEMRLLTKNRSGDWRAWRAAGSFFMRNEMTSDAIVSLEKYVTLRPDTADSHSMLARAYVQNKESDKAITLGRKALALDNDFPQAVEVLGQAFELKGQKKEAIEYYQKLLTMDLSPERKKNLEKKITELQ